MLALGTGLKCGNRETIKNKSFFNLFKKTNDIEIDYKSFNSFVEDIGETIFNLIINELVGFKLNNDLGYLAISKYRNTRKTVNFGVYQKTGKIVLYVNLHSDGYSFHVKWIKRNRFSFLKYYRFQACRELQRTITKKINEGKNYNSIKNSDYINYGKLNSKFK